MIHLRVETNMNEEMGLYRILITIYYSKKSCASISFILGILLMVYFYLPYMLSPQPGSYYLNPRVNQMTMRSYSLKSDEAGSNRLNLVRVPDYLTEMSKCPACFGTDMCPEIKSGAIRIIEPDANDELKLKGVYNGYWNQKPVVLKRLNRHKEYAKVDSFLCQNASMELNCDVSKAILSEKSLVQNEKTFSPDFLRSVWGIIHDRSDQLAVAACLSEDAIKMLSENYDLNNDERLSPEEKAYFFTSLVLNPEALFLEFTKKEGLRIHFPEVLGYCGRIVVTEHAGQPLSSFLKEDFKKRADIGMMLLGMIFFLQNFSSKWSLVFSDFNFDNFYVKDDNIYIIDAEDMLLTDTELYPEPKGQLNEICNADCFKQFSIRLFDYDKVSRESICPHTPRVTEQAMYSLACERIFSYLPEHHKYSPYEGLLHNPPEDIAQILESSLQECVTETHKNGRIESIDVLSGLLERFSDFGHYDDDDYNDDNDDKKHNKSIVNQPDPNQAAIINPKLSMNQALVNQTPNQAVVNQVPNQAMINQLPNQVQLSQILDQGRVDQTPNQTIHEERAVVNHLPNQAVVNQIQNNVQNQGLINQLPNQSPVPVAMQQLLNQRLVNQIPNRIAINQVPNRVPNQVLVNQLPNQAVVNQVANQAPNQAVVNQGMVNQVQSHLPNQERIVNQVLSQLPNQVPNQGVINQVPNQGVVNQVPNQGVINQVPNQVPNQGVINQVPNQGVINQVPNQGVINQVPNQGVINQVPNQVPNQGVINQVPNQGVMPKQRK